MTKTMKIVVCTVLSFMFCIMSIGYAALSDSINIAGTAKVEIPYGLFITEVSVSNYSNADKREGEHLEYTTTLETTVSRSGSRYWWDQQKSGYVTYHVKVLNNTKLTYSYRGLYYQTSLSGYNGNANVATSNSDNKIGVVCSLANKSAEEKKVYPGGILEFDVTYTVGSGLNADTNLKTLINFQFGINVETADQAIDIATDKFLDILNTSSTYNELIDALDNKFDGRDWTSNYIGNVTGSSSDDSMAVNTLFAGQLQITVDNVKQDATVMIKHENLDGNVLTGDDYTAVYGDQIYSGYGCEMTMYLTIDPLAKEDMGEYVPVYAIVFTCDRDKEGNIISDWYRVGDTYAGEANVVDYDGGTDGNGGSFVTDNWRAEQKTYQVVSGYSYNINGTQYSLPSYSYNVGYQANIESIVMATDNNAVNTLQALLDHAQSIIDSQEYAGTGITLVEKAYAEASPCYTVDANGNPVVKSELTRAQLLPTISALYYAVDEALVKMESLSKQ